MFISEGSGTYTDDFHVRIDVRAPAFLSVPASQVHGYGADASGWREHWVLLDVAGLSAVEALAVLDVERPVTHLATPPAGIDTLFAELKSALSSTRRTSQLRAAALCLQLIATLSESASPADIDRRDAERVLSSLRESAEQPLTVAGRARMLGITPSRLREIVREQADSSVHDFVLTCRIRRAQELLITTDLPVHRIAEMVGYEDQAYFSRLFALRNAVAPTRFRAQHTRNAAVPREP